MSDPTDPLAWAVLAEEDYALQRLAAYAVQVRYPGEDLTVEESRSALETAQAVRRYARSLLGMAA